MLKYALVLVVCIPWVASAQSVASRQSQPAAAPAARPDDPCRRSASRMVVGGMDADELRCQLAVALGQLSVMQTAMVGMAAHQRMTDTALADAMAEQSSLLPHGKNQ